MSGEKCTGFLLPVHESSSPSRPAALHQRPSLSASDFSAAIKTTTTFTFTFSTNIMTKQSKRKTAKLYISITSPNRAIRDFGSSNFLIYQLYQPCLRIMLVCKAILLCSDDVYSFTLFYHRVYLYCLVAVCQPFMKLMIDWLIDWLSSRFQMGVLLRIEYSRMMNHSQLFKRSVTNVSCLLSI